MSADEAPGGPSPIAELFEAALTTAIVAQFSEVGAYEPHYQRSHRLSPERVAPQSKLRSCNRRSSRSIG